MNKSKEIELKIKELKNKQKLPPNNKINAKFYSMAMNVSIELITGIGVGVGPGSYTGLRVGIAAAQGIARGLDVPLAGCDTLAALAASGLREDGKAFAILNAHRGNVYTGLYEKSEGVIITLQQPSKISLTEFTKVGTSHPIIDSVPPDTSYIASRVSDGSPVEPLYL